MRKILKEIEREGGFIVLGQNTIVIVDGKQFLLPKGTYIQIIGESSEGDDYREAEVVFQPPSNGNIPDLKDECIHIYVGD